MQIIGGDVEEAVDLLQLCADQESGCEAAVHAMINIFQAPETEAIFLVDATNAFNSLNRKAALHNISIICPSLALALKTGNGEITSLEGTTQGAPLTMAMYTLATAPLVDQLRPSCPKLHEAWYADDPTGTGTCRNLRSRWDDLVNHGLFFGYHPNASKTYLVVKEKHEEREENPL